MGDELHICFQSCSNANNTGAHVGNDTYDIECINRCSYQHINLYQNTAQKYTNIVQIVAIILITWGLIGKVFNCIIFLRKPLRGTSTGILLLLKTIFDFVPLLWTFIFDTKFFVRDEQINASKLICSLSRSSDIFVSWSIGFVILACTIRLATIVRSKYIPQPSPCLVCVSILAMMFCGILYNWHVFYYPIFEISFDEHRNETFTYCNIIFGTQMGYFSFAGFQPTRELLYNAPVVNFIVSSLVPFTIVALTNLFIILRVLKNPSTKHFFKSNSYRSNEKQSSDRSDRSNQSRSSMRHVRTHLTKKDLSYETTITLTTSFVFLTTNSIASIYIYVRSSYRPKNSRITEEIKTSNVYLILRMLSLIDTVLEFYIYFLTGRKFRQDVYQVLNEILEYTPLKHYFKCTCLTNNNNTNNNDNDANTISNYYGQKPEKDLSEQQLIDVQKKQPSQYLALAQSTTTSISRIDSYLDSPNRQIFNDSECDETDETIDRIESTV